MKESAGSRTSPLSREDFDTAFCFDSSVAVMLVSLTATGGSNTRLVPLLLANTAPGGGVRRGSLERGSECGGF